MISCFAAIGPIKNAIFAVDSRHIDQQERDPARLGRLGWSAHISVPVVGLGILTAVRRSETAAIVLLSPARTVGNPANLSVLM